MISRTRLFYRITLNGSSLQPKSFARIFALQSSQTSCHDVQCNLKWSWLNYISSVWILIQLSYVKAYDVDLRIMSNGNGFLPRCSSFVQGIPKRIVFRNVVLFWLAGGWAFKMWVILGSKNIYAITRCLALVPNVSRLVCTPLYLYTPLNEHLIRGFAIFLKTIFFWDTL